MEIDKERKNLKHVTAFFVVAIYYWLVMVLIDPNYAIKKMSVSYWMIIAPIFIFLLFSSIAILVDVRNYVRSALKDSPIWLKTFFCWIFSALIVGLINGDWASLRLLGAWGVMFAVMNRMKIEVKLKYLNWLYVLSLLSSIVGYHLGLGQFGYLPGQSQWNCFDLDRVSLFPSIFDSAFVSFVILVFNVFYNKEKSRFLFIALAIYYIALSANRTIYLCVGIFLFVYLIDTFFTKWKRVAFSAGLLVVSSASTFFILNPSFLVKTDLANIPYLSKYVFHKSDHVTCTNYEFGNAEDYYHIHGRAELLRAMFKEFQKNPFLGSGTVYVNNNRSSIDSAGGSESFIGSIFVRFGISSALFVMALFLLAARFFRDGRNAELVLVLGVLVSWTLFGSSANVYNFNFLLVIALIFNKYNLKENKNA